MVSFSCERMQSSDNLKLLFSEDTIHFDTVFTTIGSTTRELRVKNRENKRINISHIYLSGGPGSQFGLNIDGEPTFEKRNIELEAGDSIFIFIDVLIDPTRKDAPVVITDSIIFVVGDNIQKVQLLAWGQDIFLVSKKLIQSEIWYKSKPYVIYDNVTLTAVTPVITPSADYISDMITLIGFPIDYVYSQTGTAHALYAVMSSVSKAYQKVLIMNTTFYEVYNGGTFTQPCQDANSVTLFYNN